MVAETEALREAYIANQEKEARYQEDRMLESGIGMPSSVAALHMQSSPPGHPFMSSSPGSPSIASNPISGHPSSSTPGHPSIPISTAN
jgi:hypothetical protein